MTEASAFWAGSAFERFWQRDGTASGMDETGLQANSAPVDPLMLGFWQRHGWARFGNGFLVFEPPERLRTVYAAWHLPSTRWPFLRTAWGHLFTAEGPTCHLLDPVQGRHRDLGCDAVTVLDALLVDPELLAQDLLWDVYQSATARIGRAPARDEGLAFVPALSLGGALDEGRAEIRPLQVTLDLLSQT